MVRSATTKVQWSQAMKHYIESNGGIWILNRANYLRLCVAIERGQDVNLDEYGKHICDQIESLTDMQRRAK